MSVEQDLLIALRRIIRAMDLHSKELQRSIGLTMPQLLVLQAIQHFPEHALGDIAREVRLSQATITTILNRLQGRRLIERHRDSSDRRKSHVQLTIRGRELLERAPAPLQGRFTRQLRELDDWEQSMLVAALQRIATLMDADELDAAPVLQLGDMVEPSE